jgi:hypothetical protein
MLQNISKCFSRFQKVIKGTRMIQTFPKDSEMVKNKNEYSKMALRFQNILKCSRRFQIVMKDNK